MQFGLSKYSIWHLKRGRLKEEGEEVELVVDAIVQHLKTKQELHTPRDLTETNAQYQIFV